MHYLVVINYHHSKSNHVRGFLHPKDAVAFAEEMKAQAAKDAEELRSYGCKDAVERLITIHEGIHLTTVPMSLYTLQTLEDVKKIAEQA